VAERDLAEVAGIHREGEFDLTLDVTEHPEQCCLTIKYDPHLFRSDTVRGVAEHYLQILEEAGSAPDTVVRDIELLTASAREAGRGAEHCEPIKSR
jgi:hypothetical protein